MRPVRAPARARALRAAIAVATVAGLSACHVPGTSAGGGSQGGGQTITVAVVPGIDNAPLSVAEQDGLFRQHGLTVHIRDEQTISQAVSDLRNGRAQVAGGDYTDFFYLEDSGAISLHLIADGYDAAQNMLEILALPGSGITGPQQLVGKKVATPEPVVSYAAGLDTVGLPYNIETLAAQTVLEADGVSPSAITWVPSQLSAMIHELRSRLVSAILVPEPYVYQAESQLGAQEVLDACSGVTAGLPLSGYFSLASNHDTSALDAFQAALLQAQTDAGMGGPLQGVLPKAAGVSAQDAALVTMGTYPTSLSLGEVQRVAQLMFDAGMINSTLDMHSLIEP
jgi:NitT/TauT family transport system substrate-binding protein